MEQELITIFKHYGQENQLRKLVEEVLEFYEAVLLNDGTEKAKEHIEEEYGDVENVLEEFRYALELRYNKISASRVRKIRRQFERMGEENNE